jgi:excisionase family DNA binding protein
MTRLLFRPNEAAEALAMGRTKVYELIRLGKLATVQTDAGLRVTRAALDAYVASLSPGSSTAADSLDTQ